MKTIERNIANHLFEMKYEPDWRNEDGTAVCQYPTFKLDGVVIGPKDFDIALRLITAEVRK